MKQSQEKVICKYCKSENLRKTKEDYEGYGRFLEYYKCKKCHKEIRHRIISKEKCIADAKDIGERENTVVSKKLAEWREEYLKNRLEPKKYEPMLYFLDLFKGR